MKARAYLQRHRGQAMLLAFPLGAIVVGAFLGGVTMIMIGLGAVAKWLHPLHTAFHVVGIAFLIVIIAAMIFGSGLWVLEKMGVEL